MLTVNQLENILAGIPHLSIGVLGDLFLDRYLDIDPALTEPSIETGLDAYQVVRVRATPGAAGTIINNLAALGAGSIWPISIIGDDGEGYELRQQLNKLPAVRPDGIGHDATRRTPTYTKPMLLQDATPTQSEIAGSGRELNRLDIKNRTPLGESNEEKILQVLEYIWSAVEVLLVLDQVSEPECGVITTRVRQRLGQMGQARPDKIILVDSRERIAQFSHVWAKPNRQECLQLGLGSNGNQTSNQLEACVDALASRLERPVFCTDGERGITVVDPRSGQSWSVPAYPVTGPIDTVGAGDSTSAALACALALQIPLEQAASFANLVASITIQQIGTTGTASPESLRQRAQLLGSES